VEKIRIVQTDEAHAAAVQRGVDRLATSTAIGDEADLVLALCALVPECVAPLRDLVSRIPLSVDVDEPVGAPWANMRAVS
jgi:hypothetical protein